MTYLDQFHVLFKDGNILNREVDELVMMTHEHDYLKEFFMIVMKSNVMIAIFKKVKIAEN